jgi:hypothetical protein
MRMSHPPDFLGHLGHLQRRTAQRCPLHLIALQPSFWYRFAAKQALNVLDLSGLRVLGSKQPEIARAVRSAAGLQS